MKPRSRTLYGALAALTVAAGLLSRSEAIRLPLVLSTYAGDTLWALMVFWGCCVVAPAAPTRMLFVAALAFSFAIELSQLYHAPWIDGLRRTTLGGLVLGFGFQASDLVCYTLGICLGAALDRLVMSPKRGVA